MSAPWPAILVTSEVQIEAVLRRLYGMGHRYGGSISIAIALENFSSALNMYRGSMLIYCDHISTICHITPTYPPNKGLIRVNSLSHMCDHLARHKPA